MQNSKQFDEAEGVFKRYGRRRTRKSYWRQKWITLTKGTIVDNQHIKQTMRGPKLLSAAMPRVILKEKYLQRPRSPESEFGLRFVPPKTEDLHRRMEQRRTRDWLKKDWPCGMPDDRRVFDRRVKHAGKKKRDKYIFNPVYPDVVKNTATVKRHQLILASNVLGPPSKEVTALSEQRSVAFDAAGRKMPLKS